MCLKSLLSYLQDSSINKEEKDEIECDTFSANEWGVSHLTTEF